MKKVICKLFGHQSAHNGYHGVVPLPYFGEITIEVVECLRCHKWYAYVIGNRRQRGKNED